MIVEIVIILLLHFFFKQTLNVLSYHFIGIVGGNRLLNHHRELKEGAEISKTNFVRDYNFFKINLHIISYRYNFSFKHNSNIYI